MVPTRVARSKNPKLAKRHQRDEGGFFVIWILGLSLGLIFMGTMMVDFWHVFSERRTLSDLADGAAVVGTQQIDTVQYGIDGTIRLADFDTVVEPAICDYLNANSPNANCTIVGSATITEISPTEVRVDLKQHVQFLALGVIPDKSGNIAAGIDVTASSTSDAHPIN